MVWSITKSILNDLGGELGFNKITGDINNSSITTVFHGTKKFGDEVTFYFESALTAPEQVTFDNIITNYTHEDDPVFTTRVDAQHALSTTMTSTTSTSYVDMDSMSITVFNPSSTTYSMTFTCTVQSSVIDKNAYIVLNVNGVDLPPTERRLLITKADSDVNLATACLAVNANNGQIIKIRFKTDSGNTLKVYERVLATYGTY